MPDSPNQFKKTSDMNARPTRLFRLPIQQPQRQPEKYPYRQTNRTPIHHDYPNQIQQTHFLLFLVNADSSGAVVRHGIFEPFARADICHANRANRVRDRGLGVAHADCAAFVPPRCRFME